MKRFLIGIGLVIVLFFVFLIGFWSGQDKIWDSGRAYKSKTTLCTYFAQSYLNTVRKEPGLNDEKWQIAVDIETDFYNLCMMDLSKKALQNYQSTIIRLYQTKSSKK